MSSEPRPLRPAPDEDRAAKAARARLLMAIARLDTAAEIAAGRLMLEDYGRRDGEE